MANIRDYPPGEWRPIALWRQTYSHGGFTVNGHHSTNLTGPMLVQARVPLIGAGCMVQGLAVKERLSIENTGIQAMESYVLIH